MQTKVQLVTAQPSDVFGATRDRIAKSEAVRSPMRAFVCSFTRSEPLAHASRGPPGRETCPRMGQAQPGLGWLPLPRGCDSGRRFLGTSKGRARDSRLVDAGQPSHPRASLSTLATQTRRTRDATENRLATDTLASQWCAVSSACYPLWGSLDQAVHWRLRQGNEESPPCIRTPFVLSTQLTLGMYLLLRRQNDGSGRASAPRPIEGSHDKLF